MLTESRDVLCLLPCDTAPAAARAAVRAATSGVDPTIADTAVLLTSELVTNAVTHGRGIVTLSIDCSSEFVEVAVGDDAPDAPVVQPDRPLAVGGRGMRMTAAMSSAWGVAPREGQAGKVVWFRLP